MAEQARQGGAALEPLLRLSGTLFSKLAAARIPPPARLRGPEPPGRAVHQEGEMDDRVGLFTAGPSHSAQRRRYAGAPVPRLQPAQKARRGQARPAAAARASPQRSASRAFR